MGKEVKTNAVRILDRNKVDYELKKYENQIEQLKVWLDEFVREKYTL